MNTTMTDKPKLPKKIELEELSRGIGVDIYGNDTVDALFILMEKYNDLISYIESKEHGE